MKTEPRLSVDRKDHAPTEACRSHQRIKHMNDFFEDLGSDESILPKYEAECQGCDIFLPVNDLGLCEDCASKLERDMIRKRDWAYSALAFGCPKDKLEDLKNEIIKKHEKKYELISEGKPKKKKQRHNRKHTHKK